MQVPVQPIAGALPLMCRDNVQMRIRAMGGPIVYGWMVRRDVYTEFRTSHAVWQDDQRNLWDLTPVFSEAQGQFAIIDWPSFTEFEPYPAATL